MAEKRFDLSRQQVGREPVEAVQREIAERMGISWEAYQARADRGIRCRTYNCPPGWASLKFRWRPDNRFRVSTNDEHTAALANAREAADRAHNQAILDRIPKSEPIPAHDPLSLTVREHGHAGMAVAFMSARCIEEFGMRGYRPVFDSARQPVKAGTLFMVEIPEALAGARDGFASSMQFRRDGDGDGDVCRLTWRVWRWRGVLALYRYYDNPDDELVTREEQFQPGRPSRGWLRGIELQTQWSWRPLKLRRLRFYRLPL